MFRLWFSLAERCPRCHLRFERIEGHWLGALGLNTIVSFATLFVAVVVGLVLSHPDYETAPLLVTAVTTAVVVPLFFFPSSKTLWTAIDLCMRPLEPGEAGGSASSSSHEPQRPEDSKGAGRGWHRGEGPAPSEARGGRGPAR